MNLRIRIFKAINLGPDVMPRRLKYAQKLSVCKAKKDGVWIDLGAGIGHYLKFMSDSSYGLDLTEIKDKNIYSWNFNDEIREQDLETADVLWCSNFLEHVLRPHEFLIKIKGILKPDGILVIAVPNTTLLNKGPFSGTLQADHVNFYNNSTLKLTVEYAGYDILFSGTSSFPKFGYLFAKIGPTLMIVARPKDRFQYPPGAHKFLNKDGAIEFKNDSIGH
jgi:SAM-dependent methyltransferase